MTKRILITGTFCALNKGDAAMRIALTDELHKQIPDSYVIVMSPTPDLDRNAYRCDALVKCSRRKPTKAMSMILSAACWRLGKKILRQDFRWMLNKETRLYLNADVVIDLSGDGLTDAYGNKCLLSHLVPIVLGELLDRPVFVCAQTVGPLKKWKWLCGYALRHAAKVTAREKISLDYLKKLGLDGNLSMTADIAFLTAAESQETGRSILAKEGIPLDKPLIGLSFSQLAGHALGRPTDGEPLPIEIEMAKVLDRIVEMGATPVFVSHTTGPGSARDDRVASGRIARLSKYIGEVGVLTGDYSTEEIKAVLEQMELFVGLRMHSCIGALSRGVPTIAIASGLKTYGVMEHAGQKDWTIDFRTLNADNLFALIQKAWGQRDQIRQSLTEQLPRIKSLSLKNVDIIKDIVRR